MRFLAFFLLLMSARGSWAHDIAGSWRLHAIFFGGERMPPRDERLDLRYDFGRDGNSRLAWTYDNWETFCERRGDYRVQGDELFDKVSWVNPLNRAECASDPDMQLGRETRSPFRFVEGLLQTDIPFGEGWLSYEWKRVVARAAPASKPE